MLCLSGFELCSRWVPLIHVVRQRSNTCRNHTTLNFVPGGRDPFVQRRGPQASVTPPAVR